MADMSEQELVDFYFQKAYEDQAEITLIFMLDMCQFSSLRAQCVMIKNRHFVCRASLEQIEDHKIIWGADVNGYFSVRLDDLRAVHFKSKLVRLYNAPPNSMFLVCPLPGHFDFEQRRNSRRVDIDRDSARGFGVWYGSLEGGDEHALPQQIWRPFENEHCKLGELSASGMRLDFDEDNELARRLAIDTPVLLKGDFGIRGKDMPLFILGQIVRKTPRVDKEGVLSLGCHFIKWRKVMGSDSERWFKASPQEGVGIVSRWLGGRFRGASSLGD